MKLRDHPALEISGVHYWPPVWMHTQTRPFKRLEGEVGVFTGTKINDDLPSAIFLLMEFEQQRYMGFLTCGDPGFCDLLDRLLQDHIGRPVKEIGDLDVTFTL